MTDAVATPPFVKMLDLALDTGKEVPMSGGVNVIAQTLLDNITYAIRQGHTQVRPDMPKTDRICLVGGGPSLESTKDELVRMYFEGAKIVTVNGAYHWCLKNNIKPSTQIVVDARPHNVRFVEPSVPGCRYLLASQCSPEMWNAVADYEHVWIWHALGEAAEAEVKILDEYYMKRWHCLDGGTTVSVRALILLQCLGYLQFDLFGIDSCWGPKGHHAYEQTENNADKRLPVRISPTDDSHEGKEFWVAPWHLSQFENFLHLLRYGGQGFSRINVHGDGMLAYAMEVLSQTGDFKLTERA